VNTSQHYASNSDIEFKRHRRNLFDNVKWTGMVLNTVLLRNFVRVSQ
jgi:hypothetical protein